jgi:hypothetical protein
MPARMPDRRTSGQPARAFHGAARWRLIPVALAFGLALVWVVRSSWGPAGGVPAGGPAKAQTSSRRQVSELRPASTPARGPVAAPPVRPAVQQLEEALADAAVWGPDTPTAPLAAADPPKAGEPPSPPPAAPLQPSAPLTSALPEETDEAPPPRTRPLEISSLTRWTRPGLCAESSEAAEAQATLVSHFRTLEWDGAARLYLDPRLSEDAHLPLLDYLHGAQRQIVDVLQIEPEPPDVFAYFDSKLLLAAACTNDDVVAYYDGALHVVLSHADVQVSVLHEYTHHALMSAGLLGPAWAQEGIAMHVARETWWRSSAWLERLATEPLPLAAMEQAIPYTLSSEQALAFYAQAASMVFCAAEAHEAGLRGLYLDLSRTRQQSTSSGYGYDLPEVLEPFAWRRCVDALVR